MNARQPSQEYERHSMGSRDMLLHMQETSGLVIQELLRLKVKYQNNNNGITVIAI